MSIRKFDLMWPNADLTLLCRWLAWGQVAKWLQFSNSTCKSGHKSCATCPKKIFFYNFGDLLWPDLDPDPCLVWHLCSQDIFTSPLRSLWLGCEKKLLILLVLGFIIHDRQNSAFDMTLTWVLSLIITLARAKGWYKPHKFFWNGTKPKGGSCCNFA